MLQFSLPPGYERKKPVFGSPTPQGSGVFLREATQLLRCFARSVWCDLAEALKRHGPQTAIEVN